MQNNIKEAKEAVDKDQPLQSPEPTRFTSERWVCTQCKAQIWTIDGQPPGPGERHNAGCRHVLACWIEHPIQAKLGSTQPARAEQWTEEQMANMRESRRPPMTKLNMIEVSIADEIASRDPRQKDKPRISLVPPSLILAVAEVFTKGAHGRPDFDWLHPPKSYSESLDAVERHILAYRDGHTVDEKTGLHPLWHAAARLAMVIEYEHLGLDNNDLYKHQTEQQKVEPLPAEWEQLHKTLDVAYNHLRHIKGTGRSELSAVQFQAVEEAIESIRILMRATNHD